MTKAENLRPNVVLLSVDTFRADRLGAYGYTRPTSPNIDAFAKQAIVCRNAYTLGPFTQLACIQLFTSSRPLSYGGYDKGADGRPDTVFKHFHDAGYKTWGLSTIHWVSPYYGYTDGLDTEHCVFHLNTLIGMAVMNMRDTLRLHAAKKISDERMLAVAEPVILKLFENVDHYCASFKEKQAYNNEHFANAKFVADAYDFNGVRRVVERHRWAFKRDTKAYIRKYLLETPDAHEWLAKDWRLCRKPSKLIHEAWMRISNKILARFSPARAGRRANRVRYAVDAHAIADQVTSEFKENAKNNDDRPFFIWAHFKDNHQPFVSGHGPNWVDQTKNYLAELGHDTDIDPTMVFTTKSKSPKEFEKLNALYDASIRSVDEAIGRILESLNDEGLADNTIVVICGDHGEEIGDHGDYGHLCMQYDHNARIPMMFRAPGVPAEQLESLVTSMDLGPTLSALAGLTPPSDWEGASVLSNDAAQRKHVLMENFCRGNCEFEHRPIYMAVRSEQYKYLWREGVDPHHKMGKEEPMLFDLKNDPKEIINLFHKNIPELAAMKHIIYERLQEIPEVSHTRALAALKAGEK